MLRSSERPSGRSGPPEGRVRFGAPSARLFLVRLRPRRAGLRFTGQHEYSKTDLLLPKVLDTFRGMDQGSWVVNTIRPGAGPGSVFCGSRTEVRPIFRPLTPITRSRFPVRPLKRTQPI